MSDTINCTVCNIEFMPFVNGNSVMCNKCHKEFLNTSNVSKFQKYNNTRNSPTETTDKKESLKRIRKIDEYKSDYTIPNNNNISVDKLEQLEKYHKSIKFHNKYHR